VCPYNFSFSLVIISHLSNKVGLENMFAWALVSARLTRESVFPEEWHNIKILLSIISGRTPTADVPMAMPMPMPELLHFM
jgi:hypothetical protein